MLILQVIFWLCIIGIFHTYVLYPFLLSVNVPIKDQRGPFFENSELPPVSIIIAAYNEEKVIEDKLQSIVDCQYDHNKLEILVGSDGSSDRTDEIVNLFADRYPFVKLYRKERGGKTRMINFLTPKAQYDYIIYTDANVLFTEKTLVLLLCRFVDQSIGLIGANINTIEHRNKGISFQEEKYIKRENYIKYCEGRIWGCMMGAFGGCFAIRKELFHKIPEHFIVDDFYLNMKVLQSGYQTILQRGAECKEEVSIKESEEFRRKVRMSTGNFQNLFHFFPMLWTHKPALGYAFFSHKILRWITPLLLLCTFITSYLMWEYHFIYQLAFYAQILLLCTPLINRLVKSIGIKSKLLQFASYFISMNAALLIGMFKFFRGVKSSVWEPTERNL